MASPRGRGRPAKPTQAEQLLAALKFVSSGTGGLDLWQNIVRLSGNMAITFNGQLAAGHPIVEELTLCPQLDKLEAALKKCGKSLVISETPGGQLSVKGDKLRAVVPCLRAEDLPPVEPDPPVAIISDVIKEAFKACGSLASEAGERVVEAAIVLEANCCTGSNGAAVLQYWHGIDLPPHMVLPKVFVAAVLKQDKALTGFGFSWRDGDVGSVTFHFDGGSWIKTQCYQDRWPIEQCNAVLNVPTHPVDTPAGLFDAADAVADFSEDEWVTLAENAVMSHTDTAVGAQYEVQGLQGGKRFKAKYLKLIAPYVAKVDLTTYGDRAFFFGGPEGQVRGAIIGLSTLITIREPTGTIGGAQINGNDDADETED